MKALTPSELQVIAGFGRGCTYQQIAASRGCAVSTVRSHAHTAYRKLGVANGAQAVLSCVRRGLMEAPDLTRAGTNPPDAQLVGRLADSVDRLTDAVLGRHRVTRDQHAYLAAFDQLLRARTPTQKALARADMDRALVPMLGIAGVPDRPNRRRRDLVELLVSEVERSRQGWQVR